MIYVKRICRFILALGLLCGLSVTAFAHEVPDESRKGTLTIAMEYGGEAVSGGTLTAYRVGQIREDDGNYSFEPVPAMAGFTGSFDSIGEPELAENVAAFVKANNVSPYSTVSNQNGKAVFSELELGLYLIVQEEASTGYEPLKAFLVSVPANENGRYVYELNAAGKFQLHQAPVPTETPKPADPSLPQTGQLNWPIPLLVILGLGLFSVGWLLRFGKKKDGYEK